ACAGERTRGPEGTWRDAMTALQRGELASAQSMAERGLALAGVQPDSLWAWNFRLLRAESLILQLKTDDARADVTAAPPGGAEFDAIRTRQKYLTARMQVARGQLQSALDTIESVDEDAAPRDIRFDLDVLGGQIRLRLGKQREAESILSAVVSAAGEASDAYH